jgi:hypothetical protein
MKIEFHPDFHFRIDFTVIWPRIAGAFKGLKFNPDTYPRLARKAAILLAWVVALLILAVLLIKLL